MPALDEMNRAQAKLEKADITLFTGDIWEASLLYSQVEKAFKNDVLGQEAKFRNAKLSYYKGDFEWAQAQLLVLKAATSKLIANDALDLSMIITDNLGQDSVREPLQMFARADLLMYQNKDSLAEITLDSITKAYPFHPLADEVLFRKYKMAARKQDFKNALSLLETIAAKYPEDIFADDACYYSAEIYSLNLHDAQSAMKWYKELIEKYPGSIFTSDARYKYRRLRGDNLN
jgi:outer membrane protein assembly factor BamD (BamD/ComL family)